MNEASAGDRQFFSEIIEIIRSGKNNAYRAVNSAMVETYWLIDKRIVEQEQHGKERAEYGERLLIRDALRLELNWTQYRHIMRVENEKARHYYLAEAREQHWSVRVLDKRNTRYLLGVDSDE
jgi:hypothetical protein